MFACLYEKKTINFATWWCHFSGQSIKIAFSATKMAPPGGEIYYYFIETSLHFLLYHMQKNFPDILNILNFAENNATDLSLKRENWKTERKN